MPERIKTHKISVRTGRNQDIYHSARWKRLRAMKLRMTPICQCPDECNRLANEVDHIVPISKGGAIWDIKNLQSLTTSCHSKKTRKEQLDG